MIQGIKNFKSGATLVTYEFPEKNTKIHTYISPYEVFADATHIIEGPEYLVLIDSQYLKKYAKEFRKTADNLKKPIAGLLISHAHPDHVFGIDAAFKDVPVYALPGVIDFLKKNKKYMIEENKKTMGNKIANDIKIPNNTLDIGDVRIDGNLFRYTKIKDAESSETLVIELPELGVLIPQDLVSSGMHLWLTKDMKHWIQVLRQFKKKYKKDTIVLGGHGLPTNNKQYVFLIKYLTFANSLLKKYGKDKPEIMSSMLIERYPELYGKQFIPMSLSYM